MKTIIINNPGPRGPQGVAGASGSDGAPGPPGSISSSAFTSVTASVDALNAATSSYVLVSQTGSMSVATASFALSSSFISDTFISASAVRSGFGDTTTDISALNIFTGSAQTQIDSLAAATSSYLISLPNNIVSSSAQIATEISGAFASPFTAVGISGSFTNASSSFSTRTAALESNAVFTSTMISGSFVAPSSSFSTRISTLENNPSVASGTLSSSAQIATDITGAFGAPSASFSTRVTTLEAGGGGGSGIFTDSNGFKITDNNLIISSSGTKQLTASLSVQGSGSGIFDVQGSAGQLFEVQDGLDGVLMSVNDISGIPILTVSSSGNIIIPNSSRLVGTASVALSVPGATSAFPFAGNAVITGDLDITGSGSDIFKVRSKSGSLFSVDDGLDGVLMSVNDISGLPLFEISSSGLVTLVAGDITGSATSTASFGHIIGDGSQLSNLPAVDPFPFTGSANISGSLQIRGGSALTGANIFEIKNTSADAYDDLFAFDDNGKITHEVDGTGDKHVIQTTSAATMFKFGVDSPSAGYLKLQSNSFDRVILNQYGIGIGYGSSPTSNKALQVIGNAQISGSLSVSGSSHLISGSIIIHSTGTPGLTIQSNNDPAEETKIYDAKIALEDSGLEQVVIKSNSSTNTMFGNITLRAATLAYAFLASHEWHSNNRISWLSSGIRLGQRLSDPDSSPNQTSPFVLSATGSVGFEGDTQITGSLDITGNVSGSATSTSSFGHYIGDGSELTGISTTPFPFTGDAQITGSLTISGSFNAFTLDSDNIVLGQGAGTAMQAGADDNVVIGTSAGNSLSTGDRNVFIGEGAGYSATDDSYNVFIGRRAGYENVANNNVIIGYNAGYNAGGGASNNVAIGNSSMKGVSSHGGDYNTAVGYYSLYSINGGRYNLALGYEAGYSVAGGGNNILLGNDAGYSITSGNANIIIGSGSKGEAALEQQLRIGHADVIAISGSLTTGDIHFKSTNAESLSIFRQEGSPPPGTGTTHSIAVTVVSTDDGNKYVLDGEITASLVLNEGDAYKFDQSDSSNASGGGHPFRFSTGVNGSGTAPYEVGVTVAGSLGSAGSYTQISITSATVSPLYYYCTNHANMGLGGVLTIDSGSLISTGTATITGSLVVSSSNVDFLQATGVSGSFSGSFAGDGTNLNLASNSTIPASSAFPFTGSAAISGSLPIVGPITQTSGSVLFSMQGINTDVDQFKIVGRSGDTWMRINSYDEHFTLGRGATVQSGFSTVIGNSAQSNDALQTIIGYNSDGDSGADRGIAIGMATVKGQGGIAMGVGAQATAHSVILGRNIADSSSPINSVVFSTFGGNSVTYSTSNAFEWYNTHATAPNLRFLTGPTSQSFWSGSGGFFGFGTTTPDAPLTVQGSGSTLFNVIGSEGTIFSLEDDLDGTLFTVNDRSGIPMFEVSSSGRIVAEEGEAIIRSQRPIVTVGTNPFTASLDNVGQYFRVGGNVTCSIKVNATASCPVGAEFDFFQTSSVGNLLFEADPGVTINSKNSNLNLAGQFSSATLKCIDTDEWDLMGDLT